MGKKYIEDFESNLPEITLEFILKKICESKDDSYLYNLIHDEHIHRMIGQITNMFGFAAKQGFLISKDVIEGIVITELMWATWHDYDINRVDEDNKFNKKLNKKLNSLENSYLTFIYKIVPLRVRTQINLERPSRPAIKKQKKQKQIKTIIDDYFDKKYVLENGSWKDEEDENGYRYKEVLYGGIQDSKILSEEIQKYRWSSTYGKEFDEIENDYKFEDVYENADLTDKQINVINRLYKDEYTFKEVADMDNTISQSIYDIKIKALKKLRKKYKI